jgi:hypothetical protein
MGKAGMEAGHRPAGAPKHRGAKVPGSGKPPGAKAVRQQLHLGALTVQRLGVHCSLVGKDRSRVADEILSGWLSRFGRGKEIFDSPEPVDSDDRQDGEADVSLAKIPANL